MSRFLKSHWILVCILGLAAFFRFYQIHVFPGGLFPDEAANGLDVNSILGGDIKPFYERGNGREGLFFYLLALSVSIFGRGPWQHHIVSASFGLAEVLLAYLLTKRLFGKNTALAASFLMAVSSYHAVLSRTAFRAITIPFFTTLTLLLLVKYFQSKNNREKIYSAGGAGVSFGLGFYTYISYRMMIPLLLIFAVILLYANRGKLKKLAVAHKNALGYFIAGFGASFAWLGYYFFTHPGSFVGRAGQVSIFSPELNQGDVWGTFVAVFRDTIIGFFTRGDLNWRHNVSGEPFLSPLVSPFFAVGLVGFTWAIFKLLWQAEHKKIKKQTLSAALIGAWFWLMLVPEITTAEGIPHGLRLVGVIPAIYILSAAAMTRLWDSLKSFFRELEIEKPWRLAYITIFLSAIGVYNFLLYFDITASSPNYYYAFRSDLTTVSRYLNDRGMKQKTYLSLDKFSVQTVEYLTAQTNNPYILLDPANTWRVPLKPNDQVVFTQSTMFDRLKFAQAHPEARLIKAEKNQFGELIMVVYQQP